MKTDFQGLLSDLYGGVLIEQINHLLTDIAANVVTHGKKGELMLKLKIEQIGDANQVRMKHSIRAITPKARGRVTEENETETPLHVGRGGVMTLFPDTQGKFEIGAGAATGTPESHKTHPHHN